MMTKEAEIKRIRELVDKFTAENVHRLYITAMTLWQMQENPFPVVWEDSGNLIEAGK